MLAFWLVVAGLVVAALAKAVRQHRAQPPAPPRSASVSEPPPPVSASASSAPAPPPPLLDESPDNIAAQREVLFENMRLQLGLSDDALSKTRAIFEGSRWMGQGNPKITRHPMTRAECQAIHAKADFRAGDPRCGAPNMVAVFDPAAGEDASR